MSPLYRGGDILLYLSQLSCSSDQFCVCAFSPSIKQAVRQETLTQCRAIVGPPSTTGWLVRPTTKDLTYFMLIILFNCSTKHSETFHKGHITIMFCVYWVERSPANTRCWTSAVFDIGPASQIVGQHWTSIGSTSGLLGVLTSVSHQNRIINSA